MLDVTTLTLNNGVTMPALGLGVFQTPPEETRAASPPRSRPATATSITAAACGNERQVGEAVAASGVDRGEVFLETDLDQRLRLRPDLHGFEKSARKLGVDQIDLLILHHALPSNFELTLEAYRALETLLTDGQVRAIGVSNFMVDHLTTGARKAAVVPAVNQIEVHPYFQQRDVQTLGAEQDILTQAWSRSAVSPSTATASTSTLQDPVIGGIAKAHDKTPPRSCCAGTCSRAAR